MPTSFTTMLEAVKVACVDEGVLSHRAYLSSNSCLDSAVLCRSIVRYSAAVFLVLRSNVPQTSHEVSLCRMLLDRGQTLQLWVISQNIT